MQTDYRSPDSPLKRDEPQHTFIISYGRTGSTLLMALLSNHANVMIKGESSGLIRKLQTIYETLRSRYDPDASCTSDPYYGAHSYTESFLIPWLRETVSKFLLAGCEGKSYRIVGCKDIYFGDPETLIGEIEFLVALYPKCLLVFNTRAPEEVSRSEFNEGRPPEIFETLNNQYRALAMKFSGCVVDYSDVAEFGPQTRHLFSRLGILPEDRVVLETLGRQQGYVTRKIGALISRVPYFVRPSSGSNVKFMDVQSITRFDSGVLVVSGGIVMNREVKTDDLFIPTPDVRVSRARFGIASPYYAKDFAEPIYAQCGFVVEIILANDHIEYLELCLAGEPLLEVRKINQLPIAKVDVQSAPMGEAFDINKIYIKSRVPEWVLPCLHAEVEFLDVQSIVRFENGVVVVSGGLLTKKPLTLRNFTVSDRSATIVNFKDKIPSGYYLSHFSAPGMDYCGFALEVSAGALSEMVVELNTQPFLKMQSIGEIPAGD